MFLLYTGRGCLYIALNTYTSKYCNYSNEQIELIKRCYTWLKKNSEPEVGRLPDTEFCSVLEVPGNHLINSVEILSWINEIFQQKGGKYEPRNCIRQTSACENVFENFLL